MFKKLNSSQIMYLCIGVAVFLVVVVTPFGVYREKAPVNTDEVEMRIAPVSRIVLEEAQAAVQGTDVKTTSAGSAAVSTTATNEGARDGGAVYTASCAACHATGAAGAPKLGDSAAWAPRIAQGMDALYNSSLDGKNGMPAKGGNPALPDDEVKAAVDHMVAQSK